MVYETAHLKIIIFSYTFRGSSRVHLVNKTEDPIYIYNLTNIVNGIKDSRTQKEISSSENFVDPYKDWQESFIRFQPKSKPSELYSKYPKVIDNKINLTRECLITYEYKGKKYDLKIPKTTQIIDVNYDYDVIGNTNIFGGF